MGIKSFHVYSYSFSINFKILLNSSRLILVGTKAVSYTHLIICFWQYESQFWNDEVKRNIEEAEAETGVELNLVPIQTPKTMTKLLRMLSMHPYYQNGRMYVNELLKSNPDIAVGLKQLYAVEPGMTEHDDSPDADEQAVKKLEIYTDPPQSEDEPASRPVSYTHLIFISSSFILKVF